METTSATLQNHLNWATEQWVHRDDIPQRIKDVQDRLHKSIVRQWRQAITGDPDRYLIKKNYYEWHHLQVSEAGGQSKACESTIFGPLSNFG